MQAQLHIKGKNYGPHLFIVQLRDRQHHKPMPGLTIGEIGPKAHGAMAALDNGFISFDHVRIPRSQMLNRFAQVTKDGTYVKPPHDKLSYGSMVFIRAQMISQNGWDLAKAATIATRYAHVRRQFADPEDTSPNRMEQQVIRYPSVYHRLIPVVAQSYAFICTGKAMNDLFTQFSSELAGGNVDSIAEVHAVSSGLKAYITTKCIEGFEIARRSQGGHGMSASALRDELTHAVASAGIGGLYAAALPSATYEGDNYVLAMQPARAALKALRALEKNPALAKSLTPSNAYLAFLFDDSSRQPLPQTWGAESLPDVLRLLALRAGKLVQRLDALGASKRPWSSLSWECQRVTKAIVESFIAARIVDSLKDGGNLTDGLGKPEREAVTKLMHFVR